MRLSKTAYNVVNAIALNLVWIASVAGAAAGQGWFGPLATTLFVLGHLPFADRFDLRLAAILVPIGAVVDSAYAATGMIAYASPWPSAQLAPVWILGLWLSFALTLRHSLRWMVERRWLGVLLGGVFGPVSYAVAGHVWGAATFDWPLAAWFSVIGVSWAGVMLLAHALLAAEARTSSITPAGVRAS